MSFLGILLLFVCFCLVTALIDLVKDFIRARMMKRAVDQAIDSAVGMAWRSVLKYKLAREAHDLKNPLYGEGEKDDEVSNLR